MEGMACTSVHSSVVGANRGAQTLPASWSLPADSNDCLSLSDALPSWHQTWMQNPAALVSIVYVGIGNLQDPARLGLIAAANFHVRSPIAGLTKDQVRRAARHLGLANWNVAASPCLRSRLALGVPATTAHLQRIAHAERFVRREMQSQLSSSTNVRVRLLAGQEARLELDAGPALDAAVVSFATNQQKWEQTFYDDLSFSKLTIAPFRSGSVSTRSLPPKEGTDDETGVIPMKCAEL
jgi:hypothetical protein